MFLFSFSCGPLPCTHTHTHVHIFGCNILFSLYEWKHLVRALEHNVTIMNLFSVLFEKSLSLSRTTRQRAGRSYFKRIGISTNNERNDAMHIMIRALMCAHVYVCGVYKYFDSRKTFITDRYNTNPHIHKGKLNLSHAAANYRRREFTANEDISFMTLKSATQCNATQCDQSVNQSINLNKKIGIGGSWSG